MWVSNCFGINPVLFICFSWSRMETIPCLLQNSILIKVILSLALDSCCCQLKETWNHHTTNFLRCMLPAWIFFSLKFQRSVESSSLSEQWVHSFSAQHIKMSRRPAAALAFNKGSNQVVRKVGWRVRKQSGYWWLKLAWRFFVHARKKSSTNDCIWARNGA